MIIATSSILIITLVAWIARKKLLLQICPICAGVFLTWLWMFLAMTFGQLSVSDYQLPIAILMGGTVVGLMSKLDKYIKQKFIILWKVIFVALGFIIMYSLVSSNWMVFLIALALEIIFILVFKIRGITQGTQDPNQLKTLEEEMKNCC
ncbi:hypothetical protein A2997_02205 [Candidatus Nomurabacteria bacterium RIFCSPLOWO2_01_FULL_36_10b]|uniref:Uncharacterized protein n=1 Tax=Candidatus Nomurabacteria bacterium RIFCSPLOWO2_01_FULL_36_10b TaxID=1801766 RepID=A0A1F6WQI1_9BACT|nr:MAG: hypothetical protein A2997_02205 [Candidatus Nomurabacteria bacterium RIFCSPLOWO2_01_FULL_36_10b]